MPDLFKYRVWCTIENMFYEIWAEAEPVACPNNSSHAIDTSKTAIIDQQLDGEKRDSSGKNIIHQTSRPIGTKVHFTSRGDDINNIRDAGGGDQFIFDHHAGDDLEQIVYLDFNLIENKSFLHEGYMIWKNCNFDTIALDVVPIVPTLVPGTNTPYFINPEVPYIVLPSIMVGGAGNYDITSDLTNPRGGLVYIPLSTDPGYGRTSSAYWNAEYNKDTHLFENLSPAPDGNGEYNIFAAEIILSRFANDLLMLGDGFQRMKTSDTDELGQGMRIRATGKTNTSRNGDHEWSAACIITMHRQRSI